MAGWVTIRVYTVSVFNQATPGQLSLVIPPWVDEMSKLLAKITAAATEEVGKYCSA